MKKIKLILGLIISVLFVSCESFDETTYQIYYDSFSQTNEIKNIEIREFNDEEGIYETKRTLYLEQGSKSDIYEVDSDISFIEIKITGQYNPTQEIYFITHYHFMRGEDALIKLSTLNFSK